MQMDRDSRGDTEVVLGDDKSMGDKGWIGGYHFRKEGPGCDQVHDQSSKTDWGRKGRDCRG